MEATASPSAPLRSRTVPTKQHTAPTPVEEGFRQPAEWAPQERLWTAWPHIEEWGENLAKKEALIAEAEQLAQSTNWDQAAARLKALQAQWKTIGPVKKAKSDQVWEQFRAACDLFFERFKNRDQEAIQTKFVDRDTAVAEIEALVPEDGLIVAAAGDRNIDDVLAGARARVVRDETPSPCPFLSLFRRGALPP